MMGKFSLKDKCYMCAALAVLLIVLFPPLRFITPRGHKLGMKWGSSILNIPQLYQIEISVVLLLIVGVFVLASLVYIILSKTEK
jgi:hypothetical protein